MTNARDILKALLADLDKKPLMIAERLEKMAKDMLALATKIRESYASDMERIPSGICDRVQARVIGPQGQTVQSVDVT